MMRTYNTESAIVFNTQQCYLKKALKTVTLDLEQAKRQNFYYGAKLVRGAYMEQERARAKLLGYKDPINADYEATSAMYHSVLDECLIRIKALKDAGEDPQKIGIMVASHNADTVRYAVKRFACLNYFIENFLSEITDGVLRDSKKSQTIRDLFGFTLSKLGKLSRSLGDPVRIPRVLQPD